jgi:hypothetical protein
MEPYPNYATATQHTYPYYSDMMAWLGKKIYIADVYALRIDSYGSHLKIWVSE